MIKQLAYLSFSRSIMSEAGLQSILQVSRRNNARTGLTGILLYHNQIFFQILEGEPDAVSDCYARITQDSRHGIISLVSEHPAEDRCFSDWWMEYAGPDEIGEYTTDSFPHLEAFERHGEKVASSNAAILILARKILREFKEPRSKPESRGFPHA